MPGSPPPRGSQRAWVTLGMACASAVLLAACGGGGGSDSGTSTTAKPADATESAPGEFLVNPAASWKPTAQGNPNYVGNIASVALSRLGGSPAVGAGSVILATSLGSYIYESNGAVATGAAAIFVDANGATLAPAAGSTALTAAAPSGCTNEVVPDPYPGDVVIPTSPAVRLVVPAGAVALWLSTDDCQFADNRPASDPLRVKLTVSTGS